MQEWAIIYIRRMMLQIGELQTKDIGIGWSKTRRTDKNGRCHTHQHVVSCIFIADLYIDGSHKAWTSC